MPKFFNSSNFSLLIISCSDRCCELMVSFSILAKVTFEVEIEKRGVDYLIGLAFRLVKKISAAFTPLLNNSFFSVALTLRIFPNTFP